MANAFSFLAVAIATLLIITAGVKTYDKERAYTVQAERKAAAELSVQKDLERCKAGGSNLIMVKGVMCK